MDLEDLEELVAGWIAGWTRCRESTCSRVDGGWQVELVGSAHRTSETVLVDPDPASYARQVDRLADRAANRAAGTGPVWLSMVTREPRTWPLPAGTVVQSAAETLMTTRLARPCVDPRVRVHITHAPAGPRAEAEVTLEGRPAAVGTVAVAGSWAVLDQVRTYDAFQRQGLGTAVMNALTSWTLDHGAERGLLVASAEGRALYESLGWQRVGTMTTVRGA